MNLTQLLEMLELDEPADFEYVESFADIVENDEEIGEEALCELFAETDPETVSEIISHYFQDIIEVLEDEEICSLLEEIMYSLKALIEDEDDEQSLYRFGEELARFQTWYSFESAVYCVPVGEEDGRTLNLRDAVTQKRLEKIENEEYAFDFSECLDYEIEDYILDMASVSRERDAEMADDEMSEDGYMYDDER